MLETLEYKLVKDVDEAGNTLISRLWIKIPTLIKIADPMLSNWGALSIDDKNTIYLNCFADESRCIVFTPYLPKLQRGEDGSDVYMDGVIVTTGIGYSAPRSIFVGGGEWVGVSAFWEHLDAVRADVPDLKEKRLSWFD